MPNLNFIEGRYTVDDPLYQWDYDKVLTLRGLSLPSIPEIHFTNNGMERAIVRQASMDDAGIVTVDVPNSLLQVALPLVVYLCIYEGETFETLFKFEVPVKARKKPADYTFTDDQGEIYSFNALENQLTNAMTLYEMKYTAVANKVDGFEESVKNCTETLKDKGNAPVILKTALFASGWSGTAYSFETDYPFNEYDLEIALDNTATPEELSAFNGAQIVGSAETNIVKAYGNIPTSDIPIVLKAVRK